MNTTDNQADGQTVGIDLGTSYSAIAYLDDAGNPRVLEDDRCGPVIPSVLLLEDSGSVVVGPDPKEAVRRPERIIEAVKRQMGNAHFAIEHQGQQLTPEFLSAMILTRLKQVAERQIGPVSNAVITVPYYFTDPCRRATVAAGEIAGLNVLDIINEPTAATLTWAWMKGQLGSGAGEERPRTVLLYDLGGGTFDVTIVRYTPTDFRVLGTDGDTFVGGLDWTSRLVDYVASRFQRKHGIDPREDPATRYALMCYCERAKQTLSTQPRAGVQVVAGGHRMTVAISQQEFEELTADLLQRTRDTTELVLEFCGLTRNDLDDVLLVGGSTRLPAVKDMLEDVFGRRPSEELDPRLAVAQGAAIHAAILEAGKTGRQNRAGRAVFDRLKSVRTTDVNSHSLGVVITDPANPRRVRNHIMIPRNSPLPAERQQRFVTTLNSPSGIRIRLLEGEADDVLACTAIGDIRITDLPSNLPAGSPVEVVYRYDDRRCIHVSARELTGAREASVRIVWEGASQDDTTSRFRRLAREYHVS